MHREELEEYIGRRVDLAERLGAVRALASAEREATRAGEAQLRDAVLAARYVNSFLGGRGWRHVGCDRGGVGRKSAGGAAAIRWMGSKRA